jgi:hypothetical protein
MRVTARLERGTEPCRKKIQPPKRSPRVAA